LFLIKYEDLADGIVIQALRDFSSLPKISVDQLCNIDWGLARASSSDPYLSDSYGRQLCIQGYSRQNREHGDELLDHSISILGDLIESWDILHSYELICLLKSCLTFKISWTEYPRELTM